MPEIQHSNIQVQEKLTARLYYNTDGGVGLIDAGSVADYKDVSERNTVQAMVSEDGFRRVIDEQVDVVKHAWEFTLSQRDPYNEKLLAIASRAADVTQAAVTAPTGTKQITSVTQGMSYDIGARNLNTVVVKVSAATKTGYTLHAGSGFLTITVGGDIATGDTIDITYGCAEQKTNLYTADDMPLVRGTIRLLEFNQHRTSKVPLRDITFTGTIHIISRPEQTGEYGKFACRATASTHPLITKTHA